MKKLKIFIKKKKINFIKYPKDSKIENQNDKKKENNLVEKLLENITIDNNIFGYELVKEIKIIEIPE